MTRRRETALSRERNVSATSQNCLGWRSPLERFDFPRTIPFAVEGPQSILEKENGVALYSQHEYHQRDGPQAAPSILFDLGFLPVSFCRVSLTLVPYDPAIRWGGAVPPGDLFVKQRVQGCDKRGRRAWRWKYIMQSAAWDLCR